MGNDSHRGVLMMLVMELPLHNPILLCNLLAIVWTLMVKWPTVKYFHL